MQAGSSPPPVPDNVLARRAALGDRDAFAEIFHRHARPMYRYALTMLHEPADAEDAVQVALAKAWTALPDFRGDSGLRTWLFTITARETLNLRRRRRPVPVDDTLLEARARPAVDDPQRGAIEGEIREALEGALAELPWRQRGSWVLREMDGLSYEEIAEVLQTSPTVVRGQLHRARRTLATRMSQWR